MNLYEVLNVPPTASPDEIERAYRRLARRYHPGINPGDRVAEDLYRQIQEAYAVLGDAGRRREYDGGVRPAVARVEAVIAFAGFDFAAPAEGATAATFSEMFADVFHDAARRVASPEQGADIELGLAISFDDAMRGAEAPISLLRQERCHACGGAGRVDRPPSPCAVCRGEGSQRWARGHLVFTKACEACGGSGRVVSQTCRSCQGAGIHPRSEVVSVRIPAGVDPGARLVVSGRGHAGASGGRPGDLYVTIEVAAHPFFRREGRDLHVTLPLAVHEAALGAEIDVPTLDGPAKLRVPPSTSSGQRLRLRGRGVPAAGPHGHAGTPDDGRGDLIAEVQVVIPPLRDDRSRDLLREFGRLNDDIDVRSHLFSERQ